MPEGDTIHRLAAEVTARVGGRRVTWSTFRHPRLATLDLTGTTLVDATSHGKHLFLHFDDGWSLHIHLLMDGRVRFGGGPPVDEWRRRFELTFEGGPRLTGIDIPLLHRVRTEHTAKVVDHLGPDLCGQLDQDTLDIAAARLVHDPSAPLAAALLDQRNVAGFGNIYAVETPFICGVWPFRPIGDVAGLPSLLAIGTALIRTNARLGPQNTTGRRMERTEHWVLSDRPRPCPICGTAVERRTGDETPWRRRTAWCPSCQPADNDTVALARARKLLGLHPARRALDSSHDPVVFIGPTESVPVRRRSRRDR